MTATLADDLRFAHLLADVADGISGGSFAIGASIDHEIKDDGTPVSATDRAVEEALLERVRTHRPADSFLGEEVGQHGDGRRCWIVDGIDGTINYVAGDPRWGTLIALLEDGAPVLGMNSSPAQGQRWWATLGGGSWVASPGSAVEEARRLRVSRAPTGLPRANLELVWPGDPHRPLVDGLSEKVQLVDMATHPGLMTANGDVDVAIHVAGGPWDFAAVMLIVREAGGRCVDLSGTEVLRPEPPVVYLGGLAPEDFLHLLHGSGPHP